MATLDSSTFGSMAGFTTDTANGTVAAVSNEAKSTRDGTNGTSGCGFVRTTGVSGATGQVIYWALRYDTFVAGQGGFVGMLRSTSAVTHTNSCGLYIDDVAGTPKFIVWRGTSTLNSTMTASPSTQYWGRAVINADGTVSFSASATSISGPWTTLSDSIVAQSFNATSSTVYFVGADNWSANSNIYIDDYYYTSDGTIGAAGTIPGTNYSGTGYLFSPESTGSGTGFFQSPRKSSSGTGYIYSPSVSSSGAGYFSLKKPVT